jgi:hypothetical protein
VWKPIDFSASPQASRNSARRWNRRAAANCASAAPAAFAALPMAGSHAAGAPPREPDLLLRLCESLVLRRPDEALADQPGTDATTVLLSRQTRVHRISV